MTEKNLEKALELKKSGNECFKTNKFAEAIEFYNQAVEACPPHRLTEMSIMYQNKAATYERLDQLEEAMQDCQKSLQANNRYGKALDRRAKLLRKQASKLPGGDENIQLKIDKLMQALEDLSMCCQLDGYRQDQLTFVDELLKELGSAEAVLAAKNRKPELPSGHAINQYFTSFTQDPFMDSEEGDSPYFQAKKHLKEEKYEQIIPCCEEEIKENLGKKLEAKLAKATFLVLAKQHNHALDLLSEVVEECGDSNNKVKVNALIKRGALHIQKCQDPVADAASSLADFDLALSIDPECADVYMNRGQVKLLIDKFDESVDDLNMACKIRPDFALAHVQKLYTDFLQAQSTGDKDAIASAVTAFEKAVEQFPDCVEAYALYAKVLQERFDLNKADAMYLKGIELNPKNGNLVIHRALLQLQRNGNVQACVDEIKRAIQIDDKNEFAYETLAQIEIQRENYQEAVINFDKALPLVNTELEMAHLFGLRDSAMAKIAAKKRLSEIPSGMQDMGLD